MRIHDVSLLSLLKKEEKALADLEAANESFLRWRDKVSDAVQENNPERELCVEMLNNAIGRISEANTALQRVRYDMGMYFNEVMGLHK